MTNETDWITTVGVDEEADAELRERFSLAWDELSLGGTAAAVRSWAASVDGVTSVIVDEDQPRGAGTVDVYIMGQTGMPSPTLIATVQDVVDDRRPVTADVLVRAPEEVVVDIDLTITPRVSQDLEALDQEIRRRLSVFFGDIEDDELDIDPLAVGQDVVVARLIHLVMEIPGIYSISVTQPTGDVAIEPNQVPALGDITLTMEVASDE